jgi:hypothetical protein
MVNPVTGAGNGVDAAQTIYRSGRTAEAADAMLDSARQLGVVNAELLAKDLAKVAAHDPQRAADLLAEIKPKLSAADQRQLTRELAQELDTRAANQLQTQADQRIDDVASQKRELALDLVQIGLSVAGIFDPTPVSDGLDGMIPYIGDAAKLGKLGKFAETVAKAVDLAKVDSAFAKTIEPALQKIRDALDLVPLDKLPRSAREAIESMKSKVDELLAPTARGAADVLPGATRVTPDSRGLINGAQNGAPNAPHFDKWVDSGGTIRYDRATDTYAYARTIETSGYGTRQVEIAYRRGADGVARPDFSAYTRDTVHIDTSLAKNYTDHFKAANEQLAARLRADPGLASRLGLTPEQAAHIMRQPPLGTSPPGLTWHHGENGAMHLVDRAVHREFTHQGGMSTWGN